MKILRKSAMLAVCTSTALFAACGDVDDYGGTGDPQASIESVSSYDALSGTAQIQVAATMPDGVKRVELWTTTGNAPLATSEEEPFTLSWDTTQFEDGIVSLIVNVVGADGEELQSEPVRAVVLNNGEVAATMNDMEEPTQSGTITPLEDADSHVKFYWNNPEGIKKIMAVATWDEPGWELELATGQGICPHRGVQYGDWVSSENSPTVLTITPDMILADEFPASGPNPEWTTDIYFLHVAIVDDADHYDDTLGFNFKIYLFR